MWRWLNFFSLIITLLFNSTQSCFLVAQKPVLGLVGIFGIWDFKRGFNNMEGCSTIYHFHLIFFIFLINKALPHIYIYIYILCLSVSLFVSNKRQNGLSYRSQIFGGLTWSQGRFMEGKNCKICLKLSFFSKSTKKRFKKATTNN